MLISDFYAAIESRGDGLDPMLKAGIADADKAAEIIKRVDLILSAAAGSAAEISVRKNPIQRATSAVPFTLRRGR
jgi:hypothetical protein